MICVLILMKSKNIMPHISTVAFPLESKATRHITLSLCCVMFSSKAVFDSLGLHGLQHARPCCPSLSSKVCPSSCPLHQWCHPAISSSDALFCSQSFPPSGTFPMSWLFTPSAQNTGASSSASVLPKSIQGWFPLRLTGLISLLSKESSLVPQFEDIDSLVLYFPYSPALTTICDHWEDHSFDCSRALN